MKAQISVIDTEIQNIKGQVPTPVPAPRNTTSGTPAAAAPAPPAPAPTPAASAPTSAPTSAPSPLPPATVSSSGEIPNLNYKQQLVLKQQKRYEEEKTYVIKI